MWQGRIPGQRTKHNALASPAASTDSLGEVVVLFGLLRSLRGFLDGPGEGVGTAGVSEAREDAVVGLDGTDVLVVDLFVFVDQGRLVLGLVQEGCVARLDRVDEGRDLAKVGVFVVWRRGRRRVECATSAPCTQAYGISMLLCTPRALLTIVSEGVSLFGIRVWGSDVEGWLVVQVGDLELPAIDCEAGGNTRIDHRQKFVVFSSTSHRREGRERVRATYGRPPTLSSTLCLAR